MSAIGRRLRDAAPILCYHNVVPADAAPSGEPGLHVRCDEFDRQMRWLADHYRVVPLRELVDRLESGAHLRNLAAITFDDAYAGVFQYALPILRACHLPATIFVVAGAVDRCEFFWWDLPEVLTCVTPERRRRWLTELRGDADEIGRDVGVSTGLVPAAYRPARR